MPPPLSPARPRPSALISQRVIPQTLHRDPTHPRPARTVTLQRIAHLPRLPRQEQEGIVVEVQQRSRRVIQPGPHRDAGRGLDREGSRRIVVRQHQARIHQRRVREREGVEEVLVGEGGVGVCVWEPALGRDVQVEERVVVVEGRVVEGCGQHARSVERADGEGGRRCADVRDGRAVPVVPLEVGDAACGGPEVRGDVDFQVAGCDVVEGGDDDGLVDVFGCVVEDFPSAWRRDY